MQFNTEKEALRASDVEDDDSLALYMDKLHSLSLKFEKQRTSSKNFISIAAQLFNWLWKERRNRYQPKGEYRLNKVIDAQINKADKAVGNCLGLTLLYQCLLDRAGVSAEALYLENAIDIGPHVLTVIKTNDKIIDVENIFPNGFDYKGHMDSRGRTEWRGQDLVADIYNSRGNELFERGAFHESLIQYEKAVELNPQYENARINKAIVLEQLS
jgi:tetratricopeptide (TPR) repeat protein